MSGSLEPPREEIEAEQDMDRAPPTDSDLPLAPLPQSTPSNLFEEEELIELPPSADKAGNGMDIDVLPLPMALDLDLLESHDAPAAADVRTTSPKAASPPSLQEDLPVGQPLTVPSESAEGPVSTPPPAVSAAEAPSQREPQRQGTADGDAPATLDDPIPEHPDPPPASSPANRVGDQIPSVASSPLSDLPDLPCELPESPISSRQRLGLDAGSLHGPEEAESSASAARRGAQASGLGKRRAATARKGKERMSYAEGEEDLNSLDESDGEYRLKSKSQPLGKKIKIANGDARKPGRQVKRSRDGGGADLFGAQQPFKIQSRGKVLTDEAIVAALKGKHWDRQMSICIRPRYGKWGKCTQCIAKVGGDSCRFRDYRIFPIDPETAEILGPGHFENADLEEALTPLPTIFNAPFTEADVSRTERTVAPLLLPVITRELRHVIRNKAIKRGMDTAKHRSICDFCSSTIFAGYFFCKRCGRDFCLQCERYFADSPDTMTESPWPISDASRPRLARCNAVAHDPAAKTEGAGGSSGKKPAFHFRPDLQPVSRLSEAELRGHWRALMEYVLQGSETSDEVLSALGIAQDPNLLEEIKRRRSGEPSEGKAEQSSPRADETERHYTRTTNPHVPPIPDPAGLETDSLPFIRIAADELNDAKFDQLWSKGEPMVVDDVGRRLKLEWCPDDISRRFGSETCSVQDCQTEASHQTTISDFFETFKMPEAERPGAILKLKDWPATEDFQKTHPGLYNDFCDALPVSAFTRREGVLNLYAHFPTGPTKPDIGPKMYNAFRAVETEGGFGSTRLHMDVADAVNLMLYASPRPDSSPGCAVWDLFRAEDADKIRQFLKQKFDRTHTFTDPIHAQQFYLDAKLRRELWDDFKVASFRVYQYPGQAVFIPAGCAHQVCNLADCIKIALDFVSPHNVVRCQQLTRDFRDENFVRAWKQDVLQLYNVLWFAWLSCCQTRERWRKDAQEQREAEEARLRRIEALQNGDHVSILGTPPRHGFLTAVSSVRDEVNYSRPGSPVPLATSAANLSPSRPDTLDRHSTPPKTDDPAQAERQPASGDTDGDKPTMTQFFDRVLDAVVSAPDPAPPAAPRAPSAATKYPGRKHALKPPSSNGKSAASPGRNSSAEIKPDTEKRAARAAKATPKRFADLCRSGALPLEMMMSVARAEMNEGMGDVEALTPLDRSPIPGTPS